MSQLTLFPVEAQLLDPSGQPIVGATFTATPVRTAGISTVAFIAGSVPGETDSAGRLTTVGGYGAIELALSDETFEQVAYDLVLVIPGVGRVATTYVFEAAAVALAEVADITVAVSTDDLTVTLNTLVCAESMVGASITGAGVQAGTTISAVDTLTNTVTLSQVCTPTAGQLANIAIKGAVALNSVMGL